MATREDVLDIFLRMEQVGAYVRHVAHGVMGEIRGIERVQRFVDEKQGNVIIAADRRGMILSDQKVYGLWGLYSVPARTSGLIPDGTIDVVPDAQEFIKRHYISGLNGSAGNLRKLLAEGGRLRTKDGDTVFAALTPILDPRFSSDELSFYGSYLRDGYHVNGPDEGRQERFRQLLESDTDLEAAIGRVEILQLAKRARATDEGLAVSLGRIAHLESFLAPAAALFQHLLGRHGQQVISVAEEIRSVWGQRVPNLDRVAFGELLDEIEFTSTKAARSAMDAVHAGLFNGDFESVIDGLVSWNEVVTRARGSAPWVRIGDGRRLDVRYRGTERMLPDKDELQDLWMNSYFIDALKSVTQQLKP